MVSGDLGEAALGRRPGVGRGAPGQIDHFFHLAAIYDMTASDEQNETLNVGGTRNALELAADLDAGIFHQVSSIAASGDYAGFWDETMFDVDQRLPSPYHRTKFESERIVREESAVPWRVYRPSMVIGHSETGEMDKVDGPYYFFPILKLLRDFLPSWTPLVGVDLGDTNVVPVDYVAKAMDHLAHLAGPRRRGLPPRQPRAAAHRRRRQPVRRRRQGTAVRDADRPQRDRPGARPGCCRGRSAPAPCSRAPCARSPRRLALRETVGRLGPARRGRRARRLPHDVRRPAHRAGAGRLGHLACRTWRATPTGDLELLGGAARRLPRQGQEDRRGAQGQDRGHHRRLLGHRPGHRAQGRAGRRHPGAGGPRQGQAGGDQAGDRGAAAARRTSSRATSPTSRRSTTWPTRLDQRARLGRLPGQQRRPLDPPLGQAQPRPLPRLRAHHAAQLLRRDPAVMGVLPTMREQKRGPHREHQLDRRADQPAAVQRLRRLQGRARRVEQRGQLRGASATGSASPTSTCRW